MSKESTIYTKNGDAGVTQLCDKKNISKRSLPIIAGGDIDELNSFLGLATVYLKKNKMFQQLINQIDRIQTELLKINSTIALASTEHPITEKNVRQLEQEINAMDSTLPPLTNFILPGGNETSAHLHIARTVCRRAERQLVALTEKQANLIPLLSYLNRLSDWLFVAARTTENKQ